MCTGPTGRLLQNGYVVEWRSPWQVPDAAIVVFVVEAAVAGSDGLVTTRIGSHCDAKAESRGAAEDRQLSSVMGLDRTSLPYPGADAPLT